MKPSLLGNSSYGKLITDVRRFTSVSYNDNKDVCGQINSKLFKSLTKLSSDLFKVEMKKRTINWSFPSHIGFFVYQLAKLRMLVFYYDFLVEYVCKSDFEALEMDTDSLYFAISGSSLEEIVKVEKRESFYRNYDQWFPCLACPNHKETFIQTKLKGEPWVLLDCCQAAHRFHTRTPGLFKLEFEGTGMISLCSKTYFAYNEKANKISCKGLNKSLNKLCKEDFKRVLDSQVAGSGINIGFRSNGHQVQTVQQEKKALSYLYIKRHVADDGCRTSPLEI